MTALKEPLAKLNTWGPIEDAPKGRFVLVRGPSGYRSTEHFVISAREMSGYEHMRIWRDVCGKALADSGWSPTEWMEIPQ